LQAERAREYKNIDMAFTMEDPYYREMVRMVNKKKKLAKEFKVT